MNNSELQRRHFTALKLKYQVGQHKGASSEGFLYLILRKADLGIQLANLEFQWLAENRFFTTVEIISLQQYQAEDRKRLEDDFLKIRAKYLIPEGLNISIGSPIYSILWKVDSGATLTDSEHKLLDSNGLIDTIAFIQEILNFLQLKVKYKANKHPNQFPEEPLYSILKTIDLKGQLSNSEAEWLLENDFKKTSEIYWRQEAEKKAQLEFSELKVKY